MRSGIVCLNSPDAHEASRTDLHCRLRARLRGHTRRWRHRLSATSSPRNAVRRRRRSRSLLRPGFTTKPIGLSHPARRQPLRPRVLQFTAHASSGGELENYLRESYRLLRAGGAMMQLRSNIEHPPATYGTRHTFQHRMGDALIESEAQPQAAVNSHTDFLFGLCRKRGNDGFACNKHPAFRRRRRHFVPLLTAHTAIKFFDLA